VRVKGYLKNPVVSFENGMRHVLPRRQSSSVSTSPDHTPRGNGFRMSDPTIKDPYIEGYECASQ
jgi:hypothetical protein